MSTLIVNAKDPLKCMENMQLGMFKFVFLEPPFNTSTEWAYEDSKDKNIDENDKKYITYVSHLVDISSRHLSEDGCLCFSIISRMSRDYNYQMVLEHFFPHILPITIADKINRSPLAKNQPHRILYFCARNNQLISELSEPDNVQKYPEIDDQGRRYRLLPATRNNLRGDLFKYVWQDITLKDNQSWIYNKEKMDQLYEEEKIVIRNGVAYKKVFHDESSIPVPTVWENDNSYSGISKQNMLRLINLFSFEGQRVLCPFERDGLFSICADNLKRRWVSINTPHTYGTDFLKQIPKDHFNQVEAYETADNIQYEDIVKSNNEVEEIKAKLTQLQNRIRSIQEKLGIENSSEDEIDSIVDKMHEIITETCDGFDISVFIQDTENWITPYWDRLESASRKYLPIGAFLLDQLDTVVDADYAPSLIEYCKTLEKEMFTKIFAGYIQFLIESRIDVRELFRDSFANKSSKIFAEFIEECVTKNPSSPDKWRLELGKMAYVLKRALRETQQQSIYKNFREYLNSAFEDEFFSRKFDDDLSCISKLRNECAHPAIINRADAIDGKDLIRKKLIILLEFGRTKT